MRQTVPSGLGGRSAPERVGHLREPGNDVGLKLRHGLAS
jgi:hypothetical protein